MSTLRKTKAHCGEPTVNSGGIVAASAYLETIYALGLHLDEQRKEIVGNLVNLDNHVIGSVREDWRTGRLRARCFGCDSADVIFNLHRAQDYVFPRFVWVTHSIVDCCRLWAHGERRVVAILHPVVSTQHVQLLLHSFGYTRIVVRNTAHPRDWIFRAREALGVQFRC